MQHQEERSSKATVLSPNQDYLTQLENLRLAVHKTEQIREILKPLRENSAPISKDSRRLIVHSKSLQSNTWPPNIIPEIKLCGKWLKEIGFEPRQNIRVIALDELIIIYPEVYQLTNSQNC